MPVTCYVGDFTQLNSVGAQDITLDGAGNALPNLSALSGWFIIAGHFGSAGASGTWGGHIIAPLGVAAKGAGGTITKYGVGIRSTDTANPTETARAIANKFLVVPNAAGSAVYDDADISALSQGFRVTWANNTSGGGYHIIYILVTGLTDALVTTGTDPATAINKSFTGFDSAPDATIILSSLQSSIPAYGAQSDLSLGFVNKHGQQGSCGFVAQDNTSPSNTSRWQQTDAALNAPNTGDTILTQAHHVSADYGGSAGTGGITLNFSATNSGDQNIFLFLKGISTKILSWTSSTSPQTIKVAKDSSSAGTIRGAIVLTTVSTPQSAPVATIRLGLGFYDGVTNRCVAMAEKDNNASSQAKSVWRNDKCIIAPGDGTGADNELGTLAFTDTQNITATYSTYSGTIEYLAMLLMDSGIDTYPQTIAV